MAQFKDQAHREKIIDRIRKLLAVANGTNFEGEAATAMRMAKGYLKSYGLDMSDVELQQDVHASMGKGNVNRVGRLHTWEKMLANCCAELCDTRVVVMPVGDLWTLMYIGMKQDVELSVILFEDFSAKLKLIAVSKYASLYDRYRYLEGITCRLVDRANELSAEAKSDTPTYGALVVVKDHEIQDYMDQEIGKTQKAQLRPQQGSEAFTQGYHDGAHFDLNLTKKLEG